MLRRLCLVLLVMLTFGWLFPPGWGPARAPSAQAAEENLIQNSSFETYTTDSQLGWTTRRAANWLIWVDTANTPVAPTVTVETYHASAGSRSVKISSPAPNRSRLTVYQGNIPVVPGQEYRLSGAFKTQQITGATTAYGVNIRVAYLNSNGQVLRMDYLLPSTKPVRGTVTDWPSYATATIAPAGAVTARVDLDYNQVYGYAWFDDIQFKPWTSLKGLSFQEQGAMIRVGDTKQAPVQLAPANPSNPSLSWASSAPGVATVDAQGAITGVAPGLATITATSAEGGYTASYLVAVAPAGLVKNSGFETVTSGSQNGFTNKTPSFWSALTPYGSPVVTVDEAVYGAGGRSLGISAAVNSNASAVQYNMPVTEGHWYRWSSLIATESLTGTGASLRLKWSGSGGTAISTEYLPATAVKGTQPWKNYGGLVQAPSGATGASLYANYEKGTGKAWFDDVQLTPWVPVTGLIGDVPAYQALNPGESVTHAVYAAPSNATDRRVYWSSSQPEVAAVDASGKVSAKADGQAVITAASAEGGWSKSYTVIVSGAFPNGGFETTVAATSTDWLNGIQPDSWTKYFGTGTHPQLSLDSTVKKEGAKSFKIEASSQGKAVLYNNIVGAAAGKSYRVGGWLKQANGGTNVSLRLVYQDNNNAIISKDGNVYEKLPAIGTTGADGWSYYEKIVTVPAGATKARLEVAFELGTGTLWADDIQVIPWVPVSGIQLDKNKGLIGVGESVALTATVLPANATNPVVSWESKNEAVAVVEANGTDPSKATVRGVAPGIAAISVKAKENPQVSATYAVVVGTDSDITASDETVVVNEDQSISRPILATDAAGDPLTASVLLAPSHGTVAARDNGTWTYYPNAEYNGADTFTLLIADGHDHFAFSVIQVNVGSQQDAPSMDTLQVNVGTVRGQVVSGRVTAKDKDGDPLTFALKADQASQPQHGSAAVQSDGDWTYTPAAGYTGYDAFQIEVSDGQGHTASAKVVVYVGLPGAEMIASLVSRHSAPGSAHPRLFATGDDFTRIRGLIQTDPIMQEWYAKVKVEADKVAADGKIFEYRTSSSGANINIVNLADDLRPRIELLALMYQLTGDTKYSVPAINQLNVMVDYKDWHGGAKNFLSISEMGVVASIGYDWLYDALTQQERDRLRAKMIQEVLINAKYEYLQGGAKNNAWWTVDPSNWNLVVNGGIVTTVLTIGDEADANRVHTEASDPRFQVPIAESVLEAALSSTQYGLGAFATAGDWPEGTTSVARNLTEQTKP
ncbi:Ig-like domain-containing protein [Paenibacillus chartarius]|uniref:Ig-like domain-containing protein n=1 Tax=Paenibacillus chartarius TaxID=747481 RepID=A0ABV6DVM0_9BACL